MRVSFALVFALALALRVVGLDKGLWIDEAATIAMTLPELAGGLLGVVPFDSPPAYYLLLRAWSLFGESEVWLRLLSVILGVSTIVVFVRWLSVESPLAALLGGLYLATSPFVLRYSQELRNYALLLLATALTCLCACRLAEHPHDRRRYVALAAATSLAAITHVIGIGLILTALILIMGYRRPGACLRWTWLAITLATPMLAFWIVVQLAPLSIRQPPGTWWMPHVSPPLVARSMAELLGFGAGAIWAWLLIALGGVALVATERAPRRRWPLLAAAIAFWALVLVHSLVRLPIVVPRILLPGLLPFVAFIALMIADIRDRNRRTVLAGLIALVCALGAGRWLRHDLGVPIENWRGVARNISASRQSDEPVVVYPGYAANVLLLHLPRDVAPLVRRVSDAAEAAEVDDALRLHRGAGPVHARSDDAGLPSRPDTPQRNGNIPAYRESPRPDETRRDDDCDPRNHGAGSGRCAGARDHS